MLKIVVTKCFIAKCQINYFLQADLRVYSLLISASKTICCGKMVISVLSPPDFLPHPLGGC